MKRFLPLVCLFVLFAVSGCQPGPQTDPLEEEPISECFFSVEIEIWEDGDGDGLRGADEEPIEGARFGFFRPNYDKGETLASYDMATSSAQGKAELGFIVAGDDCDLSGYRVMLLVTPAGYKFPDNPIFDLGDVDAAGGTLNISIGLTRS